jgi:hypothetical protein
MRCMLSWHRWTVSFNEDNERYLLCERCGAVKDASDEGQARGRGLGMS